ncbi:MAG: UDP-3-O-(3-hydroxymyristoyl)glucosamine N-acyltransferase [Hyphomicrobiales bacterium]|nr:UDP-3-O-(3-hydroxymyristoyl)glucosamine N-acyltransferase [Hyphomicrobiales bacterium]MBV9520380.1 UDP-3-O-(3-hydroxymyristoyl)glucosamine N-acyltransferase [Hyphomicrobiales bacterium]
MPDPVFFKPAADLTLGEVATLVGASSLALEYGQKPVRGLAALDRAKSDELTFLENPHYLEALAGSRALACLVAEKHVARVPGEVIALVVKDPYHSFARVAAAMFPSALRLSSACGTQGVSPSSHVDPAARLETGVTVDPGAVIGPDAEIGSGTLIAANAVIGPSVRIGRDCSIGPGASITNTLVGNRVILHAGLRVGQDGFGFAMGAQGHAKVPQLGRVIIQDDVEIGANTTIDRGANRDTIIGEGTKIDNLVQIAHNVVIGRHCVIVSQVGISGSVTLEDFVVIAGQVGIAGHVRIGARAQIAGSSKIMADVPPGVRWGGTPAKPIRDWQREMQLVAWLVKRWKRGERDFLGAGGEAHGGRDREPGLRKG